MCCIVYWELVHYMDDFRAYVADNMGKLIFFVGVILFFVGVLASSMFGTILSAVSFPLGILMVFAGLFLQLGFFSGGIRSLSGMGMVLVCVALTFLAFGLVAWQFLDVVGVGLKAVIFKGWVAGYSVHLETDRPYLWVSDLCFKFGLGFLFFGVIFKITSLLKH